MTQQTINVGTAANDRTGDTLRAAFQKVNANFTELYSGAANETQLTNNGYTLSINSSGTLPLSSGITGFLKYPFLQFLRKTIILRLKPNYIFANPKKSRSYDSAKS